MSPRSLGEERERGEGEDSDISATAGGDDVPLGQGVNRANELNGADGVTYILPIALAEPDRSAPLAGYLRWLAERAETIVVDGSPPEVFAAHDAAWSAGIGGGIRHVPPAPELATPMGKVGSVLTGLRLASHERVVIADDDVRYDATSLERVTRALDHADVVRPQNYFEPVPWHAYWDTGRMLLNRLSGGDWPGTLAVRRSVLRETGGYDGHALFENLELVRTVRAAGGREAVLLDTYVLRRPSSARHFRGQRVRQAYDEFARPARFAAQLAILPAFLALGAGGHWLAIALASLAVVLFAEPGRRRAGGARVFPAGASLFAPLWLAERAVCCWLALGSRLLVGGVRYRGTVLRHAATPMRALRVRHAALRERRDRSA